MHYNVGICIVQTILFVHIEENKKLEKTILFVQCQWGEKKVVFLLQNTIGILCFYVFVDGHTLPTPLVLILNYYYY